MLLRRAPVAPVGGSPVNPDWAPEYVGFGATGQGTSVAGNANAFNIGTLVNLGTITGPFSGLILQIGIGSGSNVFGSIDLSFDGFTTTHVEEFFIAPYSGIGFMSIDLPLNVPAGATISAKVYLNTNNATVRVAAIGKVFAANAPPCFSKLKRIASTGRINGSAAFASGVDVSLNDNTGWTQLNAAASDPYGGFIGATSHSTDITTITGQGCEVQYAVGAAASEVKIASFLSSILSAAPINFKSKSPTFEQARATGLRYSARIIVPTNQAKALRVGLWGLVV